MVWLNWTHSLATGNRKCLQNFSGKTMKLATWNEEKITLKLILWS
jgi:hypothetical protein